jgi:hypothetical protein
MLTATRKFSGQFSGGPKAVADQSNARMRPAISLSPGNKRSSCELLARGLDEAMIGVPLPDPSGKSVNGPGTG